MGKLPKNMKISLTPKTGKQNRTEVHFENVMKKHETGTTMNNCICLV